VAGGGDGRLHEWDLANAREIGVSAVGHGDQVLAAAASTDTKVLTTLGRDATIRVWDIARRAPVVATLADRGNEQQWGLAVSPDGRLAAVGDNAGVVTVYDINSGRAKVRLVGARSRVFALAFVDGDHLIAGDGSGGLRLWSARTGLGSRIIARAHKGPVTAIAVSPDRKIVASSGGDGVVHMWRSSDLGVLASTATEPGGVNDLAFTPAGDVVAAGNDGSVRFWRTDGAEQRPPLVADPDGDVIRSVAVSPNGKTLAVATANVVTLFDLLTGKPLSPLNSQPANPLDVAFSPDGQWFVSVSGEGRVDLWDTAARVSLGPQFAYHDAAVWHTAVTSASVVVTASLDGTVRTLDVLDFRDACTLGAGAFDPMARDSYLGGADTIACRN
jgi:WD40 repeat protein